MVLDWALKVEQAGIVGSDSSFTSADREKAQAAGTTINIGVIQSFAGNLGTGNVTGDLTVSDGQVSGSRLLAQQLRSHLDELGASGVDVGTLAKKLDAIEQQLASGRPASVVLRGLLVDVQGCVGPSRRQFGR